MEGKGITIGIDGATGLVGREICTLLAERGFLVAKAFAFGDEGQFGDAVELGDEDVVVRGRSAIPNTELDILFIAPPVPAFDPDELGTRVRLVIDGSGHARTRDNAVPLVVPEVNGADIGVALDVGTVAVPGAAATALAVALMPLHQAASLSRVVAVTMEPVSQLGPAGIEVFSKQARQLLNGQEEQLGPVDEQLGFNVWPRLDVATISDQHGSTSAYEGRAAGELAALLPDVGGISVVATLAPMFYGLGVIAFCEFGRPIGHQEAADVLRAAPGLMLMDERERQPVSLREVLGSDATFVGRIRRDTSVDNGLILWLALDNIRKGSATNMVQVAELAAREFSGR